MELLIIRHADAEQQATSDFERALTGKGRKQSKKLAEFLARQEVKLDHIVSSPLLRSRQTAGILQETLCPDKEVEVEDALTCGMTPEEAFEVMWRFDENACVALVGHEPDLSRLVSNLIGCDSNWNISMKKAACAAFFVEHVARGGGTLLWLIRPKLLH